MSCLILNIFQFGLLLVMFWSVTGPLLVFFCIALNGIVLLGFSCDMMPDLYCMIYLRLGHLILLQENRGYRAVLYSFGGFFDSYVHIIPARGLVILARSTIPVYGG